MSGRLSALDFGVFIKEDTIEHTKQLASQVFRGVVLRTPVRTGQTRASWRKSVGKVDRTTVDFGGRPGAPLQPPSNPNIKMTKLDKIFVTNRKPHIIYLENGSPTTEPTAMMAATLASIE